MKKLLSITAAAGLITATAGAAASLDVDIGTAYVFRGATVVDELVVQPNLELSGFGMSEEYGVFTVGAWASSAPFDDTLDTIFETDWYINYALPQLAENLDLYVQYTQYQYALVALTPNEKELNFGAAYGLGDFVLGGSANFMIDDRNFATEDQIYFDFFADYALEINEKSDVVLGALIGLMFQGDGNAAGPGGLDDGFNQLELDATYTYALGEMWSIGGSLAYIAQLDSDVLPDAAHDKGLVAFFSIGCEM